MFLEKWLQCQNCFTLDNHNRASEIVAHFPNEMCFIPDILTLYILIDKFESCQNHFGGPTNIHQVSSVSFYIHYLGKALQNFALILFFFFVNIGIYHQQKEIKTFLISRLEFLIKHFARIAERKKGGRRTYDFSRKKKTFSFV